MPTLEVFIPWQMCHADVTFADGKLPELPPCHMDDAQRVPANFPGIDGFRSYECDLTPFKEGDMIPCNIGGWHDAGDYDLNVHAQGHTTWKLALAYEEFGINHDGTSIDMQKQRVISGKPDGVPDILQQVAVGRTLAADDAAEGWTGISRRLRPPGWAIHGRCPAGEAQRWQARHQG